MESFLKFFGAETIFTSLAGGILPTLFWLKFWLREDRQHPEPPGMIVITFLAGMLAVAIAYPLERYVAALALDESLVLLALWALIEESAKFIMLAFVIFHSKEFDEPVDAIIYSISVALGFSALENALFLLDPISGGHYTQALILDNFRFIGATLLHVVSSATIGIALGLVFFERGNVRYRAMTVGCIIAVTLHTAFNFSIMRSAGEHLYLIFGLLWLCVVVLLLLFERVKRVQPAPHVGHVEPPRPVIIFAKPS